MAKLSPDERSVLARKGGLAKAANQEARLQRVLATYSRRDLDWIKERIRVAGREVTTISLLREHDEVMRRRIGALRVVTDRSPKYRGEYGRRRS